MSSAGYFKLYYGPNRIPIEDLIGVPVKSASVKIKQRKPSELGIKIEYVANIYFDGRRGGEALFQEETTVSIDCGYENGDSYSGTFIVKEASKEYVSASHCNLSLTCVDRGTNLGDFLSYQTYYNIKASEYALYAAAELGLRARIKASKIIYPSIVAAGDTVATVLTNLCMEEDFTWYVRNNTLFFEPNNRDQYSEYKILAYSSNLSETDVISFKVKRTGVTRTFGGRKTTSTMSDGKQEDSEASKGDEFFTKTTETSWFSNRASEGIELTTFERNDAAFKKLESDFNQFRDEEEQALARERFTKKLALAERGAEADLEKIEHLRKTDPKTYAAKRSQIASDRAEAISNFSKQARAQTQLQREKNQKWDAAAEQRRLWAASPIKDAEYVRIRNAKQADFIRWKKREATVGVIGRILYPNEMFILTGDSANEDWGPWNIQETTIKWDGDISVDFTANAPREKKKTKEKGKPLKLPIVVVKQSQRRVFDRESGTYKDVLTQTVETKDWFVQTGKEGAERIVDQNRIIGWERAKARTDLFQVKKKL